MTRSPQGRIPAILHFVIREAGPNPLEEKCITQARKLHPDWDVRVWTRDTSPFPSRIDHLVEACPKGASKSDLIRLIVLYEQGGIYLDGDMYLHKRLDPLLAIDRFAIASEDGIVPTNAFLAAPPRSPVIDRVFDELLAREPDWTDMAHRITGPGLFDRVLRQLDAEDYILLPRQSFYPYVRAHRKRDRLPHPNSFGEHLWQESWVNYVLWRKKGYRSIVGTIIYRLRFRNQWYVSPTLSTIFCALKIIMRRKLSEIMPGIVPANKTAAVYTVTGDTLILPGDDNNQLHEFYRSGTREPRTINFLLRNLKPGDFFLDIGANIGMFSILAARLCGRYGRVFSVEPNPHALAYLRKGIGANDIRDRIIIIPKAMSSHHGTEVLVVPEYSLGGAYVASNTDRAPVAGYDREEYGKNYTVNITMETLDTCIPEYLFFRAMKIDVEGHEENVLAGAKKFLSERRTDFIVIEIGTERASLIDALEQVAAYGYEPCVIDLFGGLQPCRTVEEAIRKHRGPNIVMRRRDTPMAARQAT